MAADTPGYLSTPAYDSPGEGQSVSFGDWLAALAAGIATAGVLSTAKVLKGILSDWQPARSWIDKNFDNKVASIYHSFANTFAASTQSYTHWMEVERGRTHPFITGTHAAIVTHEEKIYNLHAAVNTLTYGHPVPETEKHAAATVSTIDAKIEKTNKAVAEANAQIAAINYRLSHGYLHTIEQKIAAAQSKAEQNAAAAAEVALHAQDEIYRRRVATIADATGLPAGILHDTIPIALASVVGLEATIAQEITRCLDPMCSDWNAAKGLLEGVLAGLTTAGAIEFLANAVTHPESLGKTVAGYAGEVGNLAVDTFYDTLGLQPPGTTGQGL